MKYSDACLGKSFHDFAMQPGTALLPKHCLLCRLVLILCLLFADAQSKYFESLGCRNREMRALDLWHQTQDPTKRHGRNITQTTEGVCFKNHTSDSITRERGVERRWDLKIATDRRHDGSRQNNTNSLFLHFPYAVPR